MHYYQRETRELVNLDRCELIHSQFNIAGTYAGCVALDYLAEISDLLLPPDEPSEKFFRLLLSVLEYLRANPAGGVWPAVTYFSLWAVRLSGILPEIRVSAESRAIAEEMILKPIGQLNGRAWTSTTAADLRRALIRIVQDQVERRLLTAPILDTL